MGYYTQDFIDLCETRFGEGMRLRCVLRKNDAQNHIPKSSDICPDSGSEFWTEGPTSGTPGSVNGFPQSSVANPIGTTYLFLSADTSTWNYIRFSDLGKYDSWRDATKVNAKVITFSAVMKPAFGNLKFGLGFNHPTDGLKKFRFNFNASGVYQSADVVDSLGKAGAIALDDGWYHVWCAVDMSAAAWYGDDLDVEFYPNADAGTNGGGSYVSNMQVAYNEDYENEPWPKGLVENVGYSLIEGAPGTKINLHEEESLLSCNPIRVKREEKPGVVHSSGFQLQATNSELLAFGNLSIAGAWAQLYGGFKNADEWALLSTGRVDTANIGTEGVMSIDVGDPLRAVLDGTLPRWVRFDTVASGSEIQATFIDENSSSYDNSQSNAGIQIDTSSLVLEQRWDIIFTSPTQFKLQDPAGTDYTGFDINNHATPSGHGFTLRKEGWDLTASAYATGDKFIFDMAKERASGKLSPPALIKELITDANFMNLKVYDVDNGEAYSSPLYDDETGSSYSETWYKAIYDYGTTSTCKGTFNSGERIIDLVQQLLRIMQASLYTMPNGQIALWQTEPVAAPEPKTFNGEPGKGRVNILSATARDRLDQTYNVAKVKFRSLSNGEIVYVSDRSYSSPLDSDREIEINVDKWEVTPTLIETTLSKVLRRVENPRREVVVRTTLDGMAVDLENAVYLNEPWIGVDQTTLVREKALDPFANEVEFITGQEDYLLDDYAVVGDDETDPIGSVVDPDAGPYTDKVF